MWSKSQIPYPLLTILNVVKKSDTVSLIYNFNVIKKSDTMPLI